ncbi:hypothetical protein SAMN04487928_1192 [Butyrivibrio proteoclasticus]|uniref:Uncharacterized protein n=1 Tax=Butyrivibrio proteoclasticus TaxID=43305 RepID=A0A1I5VSR1_9FIRM|nr:hypothetical protein SAMN04487928_1192 [Butyrivibrio proteoclasticus]
MKFALLYVNEIVYNDLLWAMLNQQLDVEVIDSGISINSTSPSDAQIATSYFPCSITFICSRTFSLSCETFISSHKIPL